MRAALHLGVVLAALAVGPAKAQYAGSNTTGVAGLVAVDKVANRIRFYDPKSLVQLSELEPPGKSVHELTLSYDHRFAYAPLYGDGVYGANPQPNNKILVIDLVGHTLAGVIDLGADVAPHGMVATRDGKLWVVCDLPRRLLLVDPARGKVEASYDVPGKGPHFIALLPDETKLYVSNKEGPLDVFDVGRRTFVARIAVATPGVEAGNGSGGEGLAPTPDGRRLIVADNGRSGLRVIDTRTDREIDRIVLKGLAPTNIKRTRLVRLMFSPDGRHLVVTAYATGQAWVIDARNYRRQIMTPVAKGPQGVAFTADGRTVVVSSHDSGLLTRVDLATGKAVDAVDGGGGVEALAFY